MSTQLIHWLNGTESYYSTLQLALRPMNVLPLDGELTTFGGNRYTPHDPFSPLVKLGDPPNILRCVVRPLRGKASQFTDCFPPFVRLRLHGVTQRPSAVSPFCNPRFSAIRPLLILRFDPRSTAFHLSLRQIADSNGNGGSIQWTANQSGG